jgi:O-acetyl-ADP-ribose deacetylase (regulator of RNase III)
MRHILPLAIILNLLEDFRMNITNRIEIVLGDIIQQKVDAIVNAANTSLRGGSGVDGAIHRLAGPELNEACRKLNGCPTGEAKITPGFKLHARFVIHTVGPIWHGGTGGEDDFLAHCYRNSLRLAVEHNIKTIAFPSISTGVYGFPLARANQIALREIKFFLENDQSIVKVTLVCFDQYSFHSMASVSREVFHM